MKKRLIPVLLLLILFIGGFHILGRVLLEKSTYGSARNIDDEVPHQIDVFFLGASHIMYGINPYELWDRYGIAAYDLTTQQQPIYAGRLFLEHALERQEPKLVVFDVIMALNFGKLLDNPETAANMTHLVLDPFPLTPKKAARILQTEEIVEKNEMLFPIIASHSRLQQGLLTYRDWHYPFRSHPHPMKGYKYTENVLSYETPGVDMEETEDLPPHLEKSFRDLIEYCKSIGLPLLLIKTPTVSDADFYRQLNRVDEIAREYDVPFLNMNRCYDEMGMDFSTDFADRGHMNVNGAQKTSVFLADYIHSHYDLPDRRGDEAYQSWETGSAHYHALRELPETDDLSAYLDRLSDPNLLTIIAAGGSMEGEQSCLSDESMQAFQSLGLTRMPQCSGTGAYYAVLDGGSLSTEVLKDRKTLETDLYYEDQRFVISADTAAADGARRIANIGYNRTAHQITDPGIVLLVWDKHMMTEVDTIVLKAPDGYALSRDFER